MSRVGRRSLALAARLAEGVSERPFDYGFVAVCSAAMAALGGYHIGVPSLWGDEGASISIASQHGMALFHAIAHDGGNLAFYYLVLHVVIFLFGTGTDVLRILSLVFAVACVPLSYSLATLLVSRRAGLFSSALTTTTLPLIYWAQQIRGYTLVVALLTGSAIALTSAMRSGHRSGFIWFAVLGLMACYTELLAVMIVAIQFVAISITPAARQRWRQLLITATVMIIAIVPLGILAHARGSQQLFWLGAPKPKQMREVVSFLASARVNGVTTHTSHALTEATVILVCAAVALGFVSTLWRRQLAPLRTVVLGGLWLTVPPVVAYSLSIHVTPIFLDRYFLLCVPALCLLLGYVLAEIPFALVGWAGVGLLIGYRSQHIGPTYNVTVDNWRAATTTVVNESRPGDCVGFYFNDGFVDFAYYLEHRPTAMHAGAVVPRSVLPQASFAPGLSTGDFGRYPAIVESYDVLDPKEVQRVSIECPDLFMISNHDGHNSASAGARKVWTKFVEMRDELAHAYGSEETINLGSITIYRFSHHAG